MIRIQNLRLDSEQRRSIADLCVAGAQLSAGSIVIPFVLPGIDPVRIPMIILGSAMGTALCVISVLIVKKARGRK